MKKKITYDIILNEIIQIQIYTRRKNLKSLKRTLENRMIQLFILIGVILLLMINWLLYQTLEKEMTEKLELSLMYQTKILEKLKSEETGLLRVLSNDSELNYLLKYNMKRVMKAGKYVLTQKEGDSLGYLEYRKIDKKIDMIIMLNNWRKAMNSQARALETGLEIFDSKGMKIAGVIGNPKMKKTETGDKRIREVLNLDTYFKIRTIINDIEESKGLLYFKTFVPIPETSENPNGVGVLSCPVDKYILQQMRNSAESNLIILDKDFKIIEKTYYKNEKIDLVNYRDKVSKGTIINIKNKSGNYLLKFRPIKNFNNRVVAYIGVMRDKNVIGELKYKLNLAITLVIIFVIFIALLIQESYINKKILNPISELIKGFKRNKEKKYTEIDLKGLPIELYEFQTAYNEMEKKISNQINELNLKDEKLEEVNKELLEVIKTKEIMYKKAITDGMTKLYNHAFFQKSLLKEIIRTKRYGLELSLIILDIDDFKIVNDKYGHQRGDEILKKVAKIAKDMVRENDMVARYGGEEFVIVLPHTNFENGYLFSERLKENIEKGTIVTVSIGVANYPQSLDNTIEDDVEVIKKELIEKADSAMYYSKGNGKNQVTKYKKSMGF